LFLFSWCLRRMKFALVLFLITIGVFAHPIDSFNKHFFANGKVGGNQTFQAAPFPCSYSYKVHSMVVDESGGIVADANITVNRNGDLYDTEVYEGRDLMSKITYRYDLSYEQSGMTYIPIFSSDSGHTCLANVGEKNKVDADIRSFLAMFTEPIAYKSVTKVLYQGSYVNRYTIIENGTKAYLYATDDNYIVRFENVPMDPSSSSASSSEVVYRFFEVEDMTYDFNGPSMSIFAFDRTVFPACSEAAYSIPANQC